MYPDMIAYSQPPRAVFDAMHSSSPLMMSMGRIASRNRFTSAEHVLGFQLRSYEDQCQVDKGGEHYVG